MKLWKNFVQRVVVVIWILVGLSNDMSMCKCKEMLSTTGIKQESVYEFLVKVNGKEEEVTIKKFPHTANPKIDGARQVLVTTFCIHYPQNLNSEHVPDFYTVTTRRFSAEKKNKILDQFMQCECEVLERLHGLLFSGKESEIKNVIRVFKVLPPKKETESTEKQLTFITEFGPQRFDRWEKTRSSALRKTKDFKLITKLILQMAKGRQSNVLKFV